MSEFMCLNYQEELRAALRARHCYAPGSGIRAIQAAYVMYLVKRLRYWRTQP